jgi:hypothetical protein
MRRPGPKDNIAQTIFLWLCRHPLHVRLTRQTSKQQQHEAALARLQFKRECCTRAALAEEQQRQAAAARAKALAEHAVALANKLLANKQSCLEAVERATALATKALAEE